MNLWTFYNALNDKLYRDLTRNLSPRGSENVIERVNTAALAKILSTGIDLDKYTLKQGRTVGSLAAYGGHLAILSVLMTTTVPIGSLRDSRRDGDTVVQFCIRQSSKETWDSLTS